MHMYAIRTSSKGPRRPRIRSAFDLGFDHGLDLGSAAGFDHGPGSRAAHGSDDVGARSGCGARRTLIPRKPLGGAEAPRGGGGLQEQQARGRW